MVIWWLYEGYMVNYGGYIMVIVVVVVAVIVIRCGDCFCTIYGLLFLICGSVLVVICGSVLVADNDGGA